MADIRRIVTFADDGSITVVKDVDDGANFVSERDSFTVTPGAPNPQFAEAPQRFAGSRAISDRHANGALGWTAYVKGASADAALDNAESVFALLRAGRTDLFFEWRPDGASASTYYEIRGPAAVTPTYRWVSFASNRFMKMTVEIPIGPLAQFAPMDIIDDFSVDHLSEYSQDSGAGLITVTGGQATVSGSFATERRYVHTARGYNVLDAQASLSFQSISAASGLKFGIVLRRSASNTYVEVYVDDDGANSRLRIDKVVAGSRTNLDTVNLPARLAAAQTYWLRGRIEGLMISAEFWVQRDGPATPRNTPTVQRMYGPMTTTDQSQLPAGAGGWTLNPGGSASLLEYWDYLPYTYGSQVGNNVTGGQVANLVSDDFSTNTIGNYTFDVGGGTMTVSGGTLNPTSTVEKQFYYSAVATDLEDVQVGVKWSPASALGSGTDVSLIAKRLDASNFLMAQVRADTGVLSIWKKDGGVFTQLTSSVTLPAISTTLSYWLRFRVEGNVLVAEHYLQDTFGQQSEAPAATTSWILALADANKFGRGTVGDAGIRTVPGSTSWTYDELDIRAWKRGLELPEIVRLQGVPGTAPAKADVSLTTYGGYRAPAWALVGWAPRPRPANLCWNGHFEYKRSLAPGVGTGGWSLSAVSVLQPVAGTSFGAVIDSGSVKKFGRSAAQLVTSASTGAGVNFPMVHRFRRGKVYTALIWAWAPSSTTSMKIALGTTAHFASQTQALTGSFQLWSVFWTPAADHNFAYLSFQTNAATATTCLIDSVCVYEGDIAPTGRQLEGYGAVAPFGMLSAGQDDPLERTGGWAVSSLGNYSAARNSTIVSGSLGGAATFTAAWWVDPSLLAPEPYLSGEIDVEFWMRAFVSRDAVSPKVILSARPESASGVATLSGAGAAERFTAEFLQAGRSILTTTAPVPPTTNEAFRMTRLGTITFPLDSGRWKVYLKLTAAGGSTGNIYLDHVMAVPVRNRFVSPSGKVLDSSYPKFIGSTAETTKVVRADQRATVATHPLPGGVVMPAQASASGVGGALAELTPGDVEVLARTSTHVPDDPTVEGSTSLDEIWHSATLHVAVTPRAFLTR